MSTKLAKNSAKFFRKISIRRSRNSIWKKISLCFRISLNPKTIIATVLLCTSPSTSFWTPVEKSQILIRSANVKDQSPDALNMIIESFFKKYINHIVQKEVELASIANLLKTEFSLKALSIVAISEAQIHIQPTFYEPVLKIKNGKYWPITPEGLIPYQHNGVDINSLPEFVFMPNSLPKISYETSGILSFESIDKKILIEASTLTKLLQSNNHEVEFVKYDKYLGFSAILKNALEIRFGFGQTSRLVARLNEILSQTLSRSIEISAIDLNYSGKAIIRKKANL